jgi:hypothetical protein
MLQLFHLSWEPHTLLPCIHCYQAVEAITSRLACNKMELGCLSSV